MRPVEVNSVVTHTLYSDKSVGVVLETHERLGFLVAWKHFERSGEVTRHKPEFIVCVEDAGIVPVPKRIAQRIEDDDEDHVEEIQEGPEFQSRLERESEEELPEIIEEPVAEAIEESVDSDPLPTEEEEAEESVEEDL
jgi:hypothetical protein